LVYVVAQWHIVCIYWFM